MSLVLLDVHKHPIQMTTQTTRDIVILFHPLCRLVSAQRKHQPTMLMTKRTWNYVKNPKVTHEGAFGRDVAQWTKEQFLARLIDAGEHADVEWVVVWKFPGDLNYLRSPSGARLFRTVYDVPLPVGEYPLYDDGWSPRNIDHPSLPKGSMVEKMRIDCKGGSGVHFLEARDDVKVAMMGSHYLIREFWEVTDDERSTVIALLDELFDKCGIYAFPCYGQHHAIVFYVDMRDRSLITPEAFATRQLTRKVVRETLASFANVDAWIANYVRLAPKSALQSPPQSKTATVAERYVHRQPHPTGSLLRWDPTPEQNFISQTPLPNEARVKVLEWTDDFALVRYRSMEGWVRRKYLREQ